MSPIRKSAVADRFRKAVKDRVIPRIRAVVTKAVVGMFSEVVMNTPVDTGVTRGSWVVGVGAPGVATGPADPDGASTIARITADVGRATSDGFDKRIHLTSSVPWIGVLEFGGYPGVGPKTVEKGGGIYSKQADQGMVRTAAAKFHQRLVDAARSPRA